MNNRNYWAGGKSYCGSNTMGVLQLFSFAISVAMGLQSHTFSLSGVGWGMELHESRISYVACAAPLV